jgi:hypothetical protein
MPQAGWYPDPDDRAKLRYWNGDGWTDERRARAPSSVDPSSVDPSSVDPSSRPQPAASFAPPHRAGPTTAPTQSPASATPLANMPPPSPKAAASRQPPPVAATPAPSQAQPFVRPISLDAEDAEITSFDEPPPIFAQSRIQRLTKPRRPSSSSKRTRKQTRKQTSQRTPRQRRLRIIGALFALFIIAVIALSLTRSSPPKTEFIVTESPSAAPSQTITDSVPGATIGLHLAGTTLVSAVVPASSGPSWMIEIGGLTHYTGTTAVIGLSAGQKAPAQPWIRLSASDRSASSADCRGSVSFQHWQTSASLIGQAKLTFSLQCQSGKLSGTLDYAPTAPLLKQPPLSVSSCSTPSTNEIQLWSDDPSVQSSVASCRPDTLIAKITKTFDGAPSAISVYAVGPDHTALQAVFSAPAGTVLHPTSYTTADQAQMSVTRLLATQPLPPQTLPTVASDEPPGGSCPLSNDPLTSTNTGSFIISKLTRRHHQLQTLQLSFVRSCAGAASPYSLHGNISYHGPASLAPRTPILAAKPTPAPSQESLTIHTAGAGGAGNYSYQQAKASLTSVDGNHGLIIHSGAEDNQPRWTVTLSAPSDHPLTVARYTQTQAEPFADDAAGLQASVPGQVCLRGGGSYTISNLTTFVGQLKTVAVQFSVTCQTSSGAITISGTLSFERHSPGLLNGTCENTTPLHDRFELRGLTVNSDFCVPPEVDDASFVGNTLQIIVRDPDQTIANSNIRFQFTGADGARPSVGRYPHAALFPSSSTGGALEVSANSTTLTSPNQARHLVPLPNCGATGGAFTITQLVTSGDHVSKASIIYSQDCTDGEVWRGYIHYRTS